MKALARKVLESVPFTRELLRLRRLRGRYPCEMALLEGRSVAGADRASVVLFTLHKCASVFTRDIFRALALDTGLVPVNFDGLTFGGEVTREERERILLKTSLELYPERGYCFAPFRNYHVGIGGLEPYRVVLMLRDPRDVLVSFYFSMAKSHRTPAADTVSREILLGEREAASHLGIDEYVMEKSADFLGTYRNYMTHVMGRGNVLLTTYEQMIGDFDGWMAAVVAHCGFTPRAETLARLSAEARAAQATAGPGAEDASRHIRQVTPGDHRRKLRPETIEALNVVFAEVLEKLGYEAKAGAGAAPEGN